MPVACPVSSCMHAYRPILPRTSRRRSRRSAKRRRAGRVCVCVWRRLTQMDSGVGSGLRVDMATRGPAAVARLLPVRVGRSGGAAGGRASPVMAVTGESASAKRQRTNLLGTPAGATARCGAEQVVECDTNDGHCGKPHRLQCPDGCHAPLAGLSRLPLVFMLGACLLSSLCQRGESKLNTCTGAHALSLQGPGQALAHARARGKSAAPRPCPLPRPPPLLVPCRLATNLRLSGDSTG